ncbi:MAG: hypothetical protein K2Y33_03270 [Mycolicibacterium frederiksbergense]|nr:hypothetical protein [Mycolicibacterium frederiksbergense]
MTAEHRALDVARETIQNLDDEQICDVIRALVHGLVHGMIEDVTTRADEIVDNVVDSIVGQLAAAAEHAESPSNDDQMTEPEPQEPLAPRVQDAVEHTCEQCGRTGTRRFVQTATGYRCAPSSAAACARKAGAKAAPPSPVDPRYAHRNGRGLPGQTSDIPAKPLQPNVTPTPLRTATPPPERTKTAGQPRADHITARCQDCTRTWTLTGRVLQSAIDMHEFQAGHVVTNLEETQ